MKPDHPMNNRSTRTILLAALLVTTSLVAYKSLKHLGSEEVWAESPGERVIVIEREQMSEDIEQRVAEKMEQAQQKMAEARARISELNVRARSQQEDVEIHVERMREHKQLEREQLEQHRRHALTAVAELEQGDEEVMIQEIFNVGSGGELSVKVPGADVEISTSEGDGAEIIVLLSGRDMEAAREYFEDLRFEVFQSGSEIVVRTQASRSNRWNWRRKGGASIRVIANVPRVFDAYVQTSGGDIDAAELEGRVELNTSGGDITLERAEGDHATLKTSGGDIEVSDVITQYVELHTSGGDIIADRLEAATIEIKTSGGDIRMDACSGDAVAKTSGGRIAVGSMRGDLFASTSGGRIEVDVEETGSGNLELSTSGGNIVISAPSHMAADVSLRGGRVRMDDRFAFNGTLKKQSAHGTINGGGVDIKASTSGGSVALNYR